MSGISIKSRISVICLSSPPTADHGSAFSFPCPFSVVVAFALVLVLVPLTPLGVGFESWMRESTDEEEDVKGGRIPGERTR